MTYKRGIWTPWAEVLCVACHGPKYFVSGKDVPDFATLATEEVEPNPAEAEGVTTCDVCGTGIVLDDSVALEHNLVVALRAAGVTDAAMMQTGGMCSAARIPVGTGAVMVNDRMGWDSLPGYDIWYDAETDTSEGVELATVETEAEAVAYILRYLDAATVTL